MSYDPSLSHPVYGKLDKIYAKSSEVIGQIAASVSKSGDHDDAATYLANVTEAYHSVEQHYRRTTRAVSKELAKVSSPGSSINKLKLEQYHIEGRDDFERFRDDIVILLDEKRNEARRRLKVKKGKRPEKGKRSRSEIGENLVHEKKLLDEEKLLNEEEMYDEKMLLDEERLSSWLLSGL